MAETLEQILADYREEAQVLRKHGARDVADAIERVCGDVASSSEDFTRWLSEKEAALRSNHGEAWFRKRFPQWLAEGNARSDGRVRMYRQMIVPQRAHISASREAGRRAAEEARKAV